MIKRKRLAAFAAIASLGLVVAACGSDGDDGASDTTAAAAEGGSESTAAPSGDLKLGIAYDTGGRGDGTFNDAAGRGADQAKTELGFQLDELEAVSDEDRQPNLEALTANGDNPVIAVGFLFSDTLGTVAAANPDTQYGIVDGFLDPCLDEGTNVHCLGFAEEQGSFLVGAAAALKSETGHIGFIGGQEIDLIKKFEAGYIAGAKTVNPDIKIESAYLGAAGDNAAQGSPDKAKEIALGWYADSARRHLLRSRWFRQRHHRGGGRADKWAIGVDSDQYLTASSEEAKAHILTSMLKRVDVAVFETAKAIADGTPLPGVVTYDLAVDGVGYATSGGYVDDIKEKLEEYKQQIIDGTIVVPTAP
ncbi:MAG: BMP family ABC transporter substrate-binding protein [Ilumatobacteraceae bacterium]